MSSRKRNLRGTAIGALFLVLFLPFASGRAAVAQATDETPAPVWPRLGAEDRNQVTAFAEDFKKFISKAKSELSYVREAQAFAEANGFKPWGDAVRKEDMKAGSRFYAINRGRTIVLFVVGSEPMSAGFKIVNSHNDSVRIEFKTHPLRVSHDVVLIDTQVHGGLKNYQWVNVPLAVIGRVDRQDGTTVWVDIGNDPADPVFLIPDLAPHVDRDMRNRTQPNAIQTEELDPILGSVPPDKDSPLQSVKEQVLKALEDKYNIREADFVSAELQLVPATPARDVGIDRGLIAAYGHDDRATGYAALRAIKEIEVPRHTAIAYCVNNEEVGSWNTGVASEWFNTLVSEIMSTAEGSGFNELARKKAYQKTEALVADTTTALNPLFPAPQVMSLTSRLGYGMVLKEYGAGREANAEFTAKMRKILNSNGIRWQTHSYKAGYGGGTIASWFAGQNMEVMDVGIGILSMHATLDVSSKVDLWELWRGFMAFYRSE